MPRAQRIDDSAELLRELAETYNGGKSIRAIASLRAWSYGATHARLHAAATAGLLRVRPRGHHRAGGAVNSAD